VALAATAAAGALPVFMFFLAPRWGQSNFA
jgi:hypothetical protein